MLGFSLGAAGLAGCRAPVQHAVPLPVASPEMVPGVANALRHHVRRVSRRLRAGRQATRRAADQDRRQRGVAADRRRHLRGRPGQRARPLRRRAPARPRARRAGRVVARGRRTHRRRAGGRPRRPAQGGAAVAGPSPARRRRRLIDAFGAAHPDASSTSSTIRSSLSRAARRPTDAASARPWCRTTVRPGARHRRARGGLPRHLAGPGRVRRGNTRARRTADATRAFHVQFESGLSVTGSNADLRLALPRSELGLVARGAARGGGAPSRERGARAAVPSVAGRAPRRRHRARRRPAVAAPRRIAGRQRQRRSGGAGGGRGDQRAAGQRRRDRRSWSGPRCSGRADDGAMPALIDDMQRGGGARAGAVGGEPGLRPPGRRAFRAALGKVALSVSFADRRDETAAHVARGLPGPPLPGVVGRRRAGGGSLQPAPAADRAAARHARRGREPAARGRAARRSAHHVREVWRRDVCPARAGGGGFDDFWDRALERGVVELPLAGGAAPARVPFRGDVGRGGARRAGGARPGAARRLRDRTCTRRSRARDGRHANNPWLQELPDPITRLTWGNAAAIAPATAAALGVRNGDVVSLRDRTGKLELPVFVQPGQDAATISVALGYGRTRGRQGGRRRRRQRVPLAARRGGVRRLRAPSRSRRPGRRRATRRRARRTSRWRGGRSSRRLSARRVARAPAEQRARAPADPVGGAADGGPPLGDGDRPRRLHRLLGAAWSPARRRTTSRWSARTRCARRREMHWMRIDRYYDGRRRTTPAASTSR